MALAEKLVICYLVVAVAALGWFVGCAESPLELFLGEGAVLEMENYYASDNGSINIDKSDRTTASQTTISPKGVDRFTP